MIKDERHSRTVLLRKLSLRGERAELAEREALGP